MANARKIIKARGLPPRITDQAACPWITDQSVCPAIPLNIPDGPPAALLPPGEEPEMSIDEMIDAAAYGRLYYQRSGRYLGVFLEYPQAGQVDEYYYARQWIPPDGRLPWE